MNLDLGKEMCLELKICMIRMRSFSMGTEGKIKDVNRLSLLNLTIYKKRFVLKKVEFLVYNQRA